MIVVVVAPPLSAGDALPRLAETAPVSAEEALALYRASLADTCRTVDRSGGDLLVNYPDADAEDPAAPYREVAASVDAVDDARFEVQVGSTFAARAGNAVTHLLESEGENAVAVVPGDAPFLARTDVDGAAMRLRRHDAVLGPSRDGSVALAGFADPADFEDAWEPPALRTLARRCADADLSVDFLPARTRITDGSALAEVIATIDAYRAAERAVPPNTARVVEEQDLGVEADGDGGLEIERGTDSS